MNTASLLVPPITKGKRVDGRIKQLSEDFIVSEKIDDEHILNPRDESYNLPGKKGLFLHFVLVKNNIDTSVALDWIANLWKVNRNDLSIAGTKEKEYYSSRGVTVQYLMRLSVSTRRTAEFTYSFERQ